MKILKKTITATLPNTGVIIDYFSSPSPHFPFHLPASKPSQQQIISSPANRSFG
jgi:hypothetical protein